MSSCQLGAHRERHVGVWAVSAAPHQLFFSVQNDIFSAWWLPRESLGVIPFSQLHLHLCGPSLLCLLTLLWEDEQEWVWGFLVSFVKILLSLSWVFFNGQLYGLIVTFFHVVVSKVFLPSYLRFLLKPCVAVSRFHCSSRTALWLPTWCTVLTKNPLSCYVSPIVFINFPTYFKGLHLITESHFLKCWKIFLLWRSLSTVLTAQNKNPI